MAVGRSLDGLVAMLGKTLEREFLRRFGWRVMVVPHLSDTKVHIMAWNPLHPADATLETWLSERVVREGYSACFNVAMAEAEQAYSKTFPEVIAG